jgi:transmembrane sensor
MKWLETPQNDGERLLREGLDQATRRMGDEITHRRVFAKVVEGIETPERHWVRGRFLLVCAAVVLLVGAAAGLSKLTGSSVPGQIANQRPKALPGVVPATQASKVAEEPALLESERVPGHVVRTRAGEHARVALGGGAEAEMSENSAISWDIQHRPSILQGKTQLTVPHQLPGWRFSVTAGPYVVTVVGTKFEVEVANRTVGVEVKEGVVEVWRGNRSTRLVAGDAWNGPLYPEETPSSASVAPAERPAAAAPARAALSASRNLQDAEAALQAGETTRAVEILTRTAQGSGLAAENAAYELGRITRYHLNRPRQAVGLWEKYRTRFPSGILRTEADLSIVDTLSSLGEVHAALAEADAFLVRHPGSERRFEVQRLAERLRAAESAAGSR